MLLSLQNKLIKGQSKFQCSIVKSVESILQETESSPTDLKEIPEEIDFKILTESKEKVPVYEAVFEKTKSEIEKEEEKETLTESSAVGEESLDNIFKDTTLFDINLMKYVSDTEFIQNEESLFDINEE